MSTLRVSFTAGDKNPKEVAGQIVRFLRRLEAAEVKAELFMHRPVVDVRVRSPAEAAGSASEAPDCGEQVADYRQRGAAIRLSLKGL